MSPEEAELLAFLSRPELRRLWPLVRGRLERRGTGEAGAFAVGGVVRLPGTSPEERSALAGLLGLRRLPAGDVRIPLERLDRTLRRSRFGVGLEAALTLLDGPLRDRPAEQAEQRLRRQGLWEDAAAHPTVAAHPGLRGWLDDLLAAGLLRRLAAGPDEEQTLLDQALAVLTALLARRPETRLPVLARETLGSSHALDPGRPAATLVLRALALLHDRPPPRSAAERRDLWQAAGVETDDLSCDVLALNLAPTGGGPVGDALRALAAAGEPARITLRQLAGSGLSFPAGLRVRVCENPVVVAAAADRWGSACPPLVCAGGFPNHAVRTLLGHLAGRQAEVLYHGDFDWAGLQIANKLRETVPFQPWRFEAGDYRAALAAGGERLALREGSVAAHWDPDLGPAMSAAGVAVEEEAVLGDLLADLADPVLPRWPKWRCPSPNS